MTNKEKFNILIVEDHELTRFGFITAFEGVKFINNIFEASSAEEGIEICDNNDIDLIIMDLGLPEMNGIEATRVIKSKHNDIKVVIFTSHNDDNEVLDSIKAGANAYCSKEIKPQRLIDVVRSVLDGAAWFDPSVSRLILQSAATTDHVNEETKQNTDYNLTAREEQILKLITQGFGNTDIAAELALSVNTTKVHVASILKKLEVNDRLQAALKAIREKIV
jgi:DNA-binding NarL/FixJ family response regulator